MDNIYLSVWYIVKTLYPSGNIVSCPLHLVVCVVVVGGWLFVLDVREVPEVVEVVAVAVAAVAVVGGTQVVAENKTIINSDEFLTQIKRAAWLGLPAPADFICLL